MLANLHELDKREIFSKIVQLQDQGVGVERSRSRIADDFNIEVDDVAEIEVEGLTKSWPPFDKS